MIQVIRRGIFETNSSSAHTLSIGKVTEEELLPSNKKGKIILGEEYYGAYGDQPIIFSTTLEKIDYMSISTENNKEHKDMLLEAIQTKYPNIEFEFTYAGGMETSERGWKSVKTLRDLQDILFSKDTHIELIRDG